MRAAISSAGFPSDTHQLVDACIARVRSAAHLDDEDVLPPLPKLAPRRDVVVFTKSQTGVAAAATTTPVAVVAPSAPRGAARARRWPLFLCAFIASTAGGAAFVASPAGQHPAVQQVTSSARVHTAAALHAAIASVSSML
jgi:hypothetical protein